MPPSKETISYPRKSILRSQKEDIFLNKTVQVMITLNQESTEVSYTLIFKCSKQDHMG